jgi:hypothetical protein
MKENKIYLIFSGILVILFITLNVRILIKRNNINKEYPILLIPDSLDETISYKFSDDDFKYTPSALFFVTSSGRKMSISAKINPNFGDGSVGVNDVSEVSDRIIKKANNDTIYIYKNSPKDISIYYFILSND